MSDSKRVKLDPPLVQILDLPDNVLERIAHYLPWQQQFSMKRISIRFQMLKFKDRETDRLDVKDDGIPDDGKTIFDVLQMLPNLTKLYELQSLETRGQFCWYNDLLVVGELNGTEEQLARNCPKIEEFIDDYDWSEYDTDNRSLFPDEGCQKFPIRFVCGYLNALKQLYPDKDPEIDPRIYYGEWNESDENDKVYANVVKELALWCPFIKVEFNSPTYEPSWIGQLREDQIEYAD